LWLAFGINWVLKEVEVVLLVNDSEFSSLKDDPVIINGFGQIFSAVSACFLEFCFEPLFESEAVAKVFNGFVEGEEGILRVLVTVNWEAWDGNSSVDLVET
jgi:hypothetical protein